jgi:hypothetical protein
MMVKMMSQNPTPYQVGYVHLGGDATKHQTQNISNNNKSQQHEANAHEDDVQEEKERVQEGGKGKHKHLKHRMVRVV